MGLLDQYINSSYTMAVLVVVLNIFIQSCTAAVILNQSLTTDNVHLPPRNSDILRQLLNQATLIRMSMMKDLQTLQKDHRKLEKENQAREREFKDLTFEIEELRNETISLKNLNVNLTNEVTDLLNEKDKTEKIVIARDRSIDDMEKKIEELSKISSLSTQDVINNITDIRYQLSGYPDLLVQAACAGHSKTPGHVAAVRRTCSNEAPSCDTVCKSATPQMKARVNEGSKEATCFMSFHFYDGDKKIKPGVAGKFNRLTYRYTPGACSGQYCGPNFCCCRY
ncbi:uncharacterized protein LOC133183653 [Saccostrea echinata]|uniref:uncharacterized protein LOC133183653 n=1 Tax=Saccostrea echinata TaxID=191078 RepID=UPI002A83FB53|nr:uncharacterized protein LOC133183653 [Saccostrea echinata]